MTGDVRDPCDEGTHHIVRNEDGFKVCTRCELDLQNITDWVGHEVTAEEYDVE